MRLIIVLILSLFASSCTFVSTLPQSSGVGVAPGQSLSGSVNGYRDSSVSVEALFFGDTHFARGYEYYDKREGDYQDRIIRSIKTLSGGLESYDIVSVNFEAAPIDLAQCPKTSKSIVLATNLKHIEFFQKIGINMFQTANNHFYDCGQQIADAAYPVFAQYGIDAPGMSRNGDLRFIKKDINGLKLAFVSLNDVDMKINQEKTKKVLSDLEEDGYVTTLNVHWGDEYAKGRHNHKQEELAKLLIDWGVDLIVGHHPHVVQDIGEYKGVEIYYSLGNFLFDQPFPETLEGHALSVSYTQTGIDSELRVFHRDKKLYIPSWD